MSVVIILLQDNFILNSVDEFLTGEPLKIASVRFVNDSFHEPVQLIHQNESNHKNEPISTKHSKQQPFYYLAHLHWLWHFLRA